VFVSLPSVFVSLPSVFVSLPSVFVSLPSVFVSLPSVCAQLFCSHGNAIQSRHILISGKKWGKTVESGRQTCENKSAEKVANINLPTRVRRS
jgi:hypothetical protein